MSVIEHGAIDDALVLLREVFEILVVGCDDAPSAAVEQTMEHGLGDGCAYLRLRAAAHLVNENKAAWAGLFHHHLHIVQMSAVGGELVGDTLLVANVDHDAIKETYF